MLLQPVPPTRPLGLPELRQRVKTYNHQQLLYGVALIPGSILAWIVSFAILYYPIGYLLAVLRLPPVWALLPTMLGMAALVGYGIWNVSAIVGHEDDRVVEQALNTPLTESSLAYSTQQYALLVGVAIEFMLCAPKSVVLSIQSCRSLLHVDHAVLQQAHGIRQQLFENRDMQRWMPLDAFAEFPRAMVLLHRLKLITLDERNGLVRLTS